MGAIASSIALAVPRSAGLQGLRFDVRTGARRASVALLLLLAALVSADAASGAAREQALLRVATADRTSLVLVSACAPGGVTVCRSSTAFSIAPGVFVTASHALLGSQLVVIASAHSTVTATVEQVDDEDDLAVLRSSLVLPALRVAAPVAGEDAAVICSRRAISADGLDGQPANYVGQVGGAPIRVDNGGHQLLLDRVAGASSVLGCSGSPVVDRSGAVTGVLIAGDGANAGMVDADRLAGLLGDR